VKYGHAFPNGHFPSYESYETSYRRSVIDAAVTRTEEQDEACRRVVERWFGDQDDVIADVLELLGIGRSE